jgi:copper chaperone NosL
MARVAAVSARAAVRLAAAAIVVIATGCAAATPKPAQLDARTEPCGYCRMIVSDQRFASQIVAPYEDPKFFDDLGCLVNYLATSGVDPGVDTRGRVIFVADHRTREWVAADRAVFSRVDALGAPMGSHVIAHASLASRLSDPDARSAVALESTAVFTRPVPTAGRR